MPLSVKHLRTINMNNESAHSELVEGCRSWFDKPILSEVEGLTRNGSCHVPYAIVQVICAQSLNAERFGDVKKEEWKFTAHFDLAYMGMDVFSIFLRRFS